MYLREPPAENYFRVPVSANFPLVALPHSLGKPHVSRDGFNRFEAVENRFGELVPGSTRVIPVPKFPVAFIRAELVFRSSWNLSEAPEYIYCGPTTPWIRYGWDCNYCRIVILTHTDGYGHSRCWAEVIW